MHKSTTLFMYISFLIFFFPVAAELCGDESSLVIAQDKKEFITDKSNKTKTTQSATIPNAPQVTEDTVSVKDDAGNVLMTVTDEGSAGSVKLNDAGAVTPSTNKLYNNGGSLYWNGSALTTGSGVTEINDLTDAKSDGASVFIGISAGQNDDAGASDGVKNNNTAVGRGALGENLTGNRNTAIGYTALNENSTGNRNTGIGYQALNDNITGSGNVALGYLAGHDETGSDKLYIENSSSLTPLIWGDFANDSIRINGTFDVTTKTITPQLQIITGATDGYVLTSDATGNASWQIVASGAATEINDLTDAKYDGSSLFLGNGSGVSDDGTANSNTAVGKDALNSNTSGVGNLANGFQTLWKNSTGKMNSASGASALSNNTTGDANTASGHLSLSSNTIADSNTAIGWQALRFNTTGSSNTATGTAALWKNTTGNNNTANGQNALYTNQTGNNNTAIGYNSLKKNTASGNTATGNNALTTNTIGVNNAALGDNALKNNVDGDGNVGLGKSALFTNNSGGGNIGVGLNSLYKNTSGSTNIALGQGSEYYNTTGSNNIGIGYRANLNNSTGINNTIIGHDAAGGGGSHSKSGSVFLGYSAGYGETTDNKLYIENSNSSSPLIWGDFAADSIKINGGLEITSKTKTPLLQVTTGATNGYVLTSDVSGNATWQAAASGVSEINDLADAKYDGTSLFLGNGAGGTTDDGSNRNTAVGKDAFNSNTSGLWNVAFGYEALNRNSTGTSNVANGYRALFYNTLGSTNSAFGNSALFLNTEGVRNTALGYHALYNNITGNSNIALGYQSLYRNTEGDFNIAIGSFALNFITGHESLVAIGDSAMFSLGFGSPPSFVTYNTAVGARTLVANKSGQDNTAIGYEALNKTTVNGNTAIGSNALRKNSSGPVNTAIGSRALLRNTTGGQNTAIGYRALKYNITEDQNTAVGAESGIVSTISNINNSTAIGYNAHTTFANQVRIGNSSVGSIGGYSSWSNISDGRYKQNVRENVTGLEFIMGLRPVTYNFDMDLLAQNLQEDVTTDVNGNKIYKEPSTQTLSTRNGKTSVRHSGFIAQEVEELVNELGTDFSGVEVPQNEQNNYFLRYADFVVPIVKAMQEQQKLILELKKEIEYLKLK